MTGEPFPAWCWKVQDGCLVTIPGLKAFQDLRTAEEYRDFEFTFEWRMAPAANSGVKYRLEKVDRWKARDSDGFHARARGYEFQLVDDSADEARKEDHRYWTGALYGVQAPERVKLHPPGEFNQGLLVVRGDRAEHWVNGVRVLVHSGMRPGPSPIALQHHNSEVWFRGLRVET